MGRKPFQKGDQVVMHSCIEAESHEGRVWKVRSDGEFEVSGHKSVMLEGFSGSFGVEYLRLHVPMPFVLTEVQMQKIGPAMKDFIDRLERNGFELQNHKTDTIHFTSFDRNNEITIRVFDRYEDKTSRWEVDFTSKAIGRFGLNTNEKENEERIISRLEDLYFMATEPEYIENYKMLKNSTFKLKELKVAEITLPLLQRGNEIKQLSELVEKLTTA